MAVKHFLYFKSILVSSTSPPFPQLQLRVALHLLIILISVAPCPMRFFPLPSSSSSQRMEKSRTAARPLLTKRWLHLISVFPIKWGRGDEDPAILIAIRFFSS